MLSSSNTKFIYYMASPVGRQNQWNPVLWLAIQVGKELSCPLGTTRVSRKANFLESWSLFGQDENFKLEKGPTDKAKEPDPSGSDQQNLRYKTLKTEKLTVR